MKMTDKNAISTDWQNVGNDMRYAMGLQQRQPVRCVGALTAFLDGVRSLNPFGEMAKDICKHR